MIVFLLFIIALPTLASIAIFGFAAIYYIGKLGILLIDHLLGVEN